MFSWRKLFGLTEPAPSSESATAVEFVDYENSDLEPPPEYERYRVPRQVVLLRPKEPYARWAHQSLRRSQRALRKLPEYAQALAADPALPTLAELRQDCTAYLIEWREDEGLSAKEQVEHDFVFFFKRELEQWDEDTSRWPPKLTLALFRQWFGLESFDMVLDTTKV